ncbi:MAG: hypothetical protein CMH57_12090 [Myxococcales bacterium]|nr:hypothetical protein [Myxococcales bacterium]
MLNHFQKGGSPRRSRAPARAALRGWACALGVALVCGACTSTTTPSSNKPQLRGAGSFINAHQTADGNAPLYASSHALVIGIDEYPNATSLSGAARDARAVAQELEERGVQVELLVNEEATRSGILKVLTQLMSERVHEDDRFIMYFAGHGHTVGGGDDAIGYLLPHEAGFDDVAISGISMGDVQDLFRVIKARHAMFVADACYSGLALPQMRGHKDAAIPGYLERALRAETRVAFVAGSSNQQVIDNWQGHGLFTYFFLAGIRGGADFNNDRLVTSQELLTFVSDRVQRTAYDMFAGHAQVPHMGKVGEGDLVFVASGGQGGAASPGALQTTRGDTSAGAWLEPEDVSLLCQHPMACVEVGELFLAKGRAHKAAVFYEYACTHEVLEACVQHGVIAEEVLKDPKQARAQYTRACEGELAEGCRRLGLLAEVGPVVTRDRKLAADYYRRACELNDGSEGCDELKALCEQTNTLSACQPCAEGARYIVSQGCSCESEAIHVAGHGCKCLDGAEYNDGCSCAGGARYVAGQGCACEDGARYEVAQGCVCPEDQRYCVFGGCTPKEESCPEGVALASLKREETPPPDATLLVPDEHDVRTVKAEDDKPEDDEYDAHIRAGGGEDGVKAESKSKKQAKVPRPRLGAGSGSGGWTIGLGQENAPSDLIEAKRQVALALQKQGAALRTCHARNMTEPVTIELRLDVRAGGLGGLDVLVREGEAPAAFIACVKERVESTPLPTGWEFEAARVLTFGE